jgi:hypothetical protein
MKGIVRPLAVAIGSLLIVMAATVSAHHGSASFSDQEVTLKGKVTEWLWANPHCFLKMDVADEAGAVKNWNLEMGNPTDMTQRGFRRNTFKAGDEVTVTLQPVKSGAPVGRIRFVILATGQKL